MLLSIDEILKKTEFQNAVSDVIYLYDRDYSEKTVIQAVGNRYMLNREERAILYRGISKYTYNKCLNIVSSGSLENKNIIIDGYNVLITLASYLTGDIVFKGIDRITRDIAGTRSAKYLKGQHIRSLEEMFKAFSILKVSEVKILLDKQVSRSGELSSLINSMFLFYNLKGKSCTVRSPDHLLKRTDCVVCSSDSVVIEKALKVFDLPGFIIEKIFTSNILTIRKL